MSITFGFDRLSVSLRFDEIIGESDFERLVEMIVMFETMEEKQEGK